MESEAIQISDIEYLLVGILEQKNLTDKHVAVCLALPNVSYLHEVNLCKLSKFYED